jgi:hypothetical protein
MIGGKGEDLSSQANLSKEGRRGTMVVETQQTKVSITAIMPDRALEFVAMGVVLKGIQRGWMSSFIVGEQPYYAWRYIIDALNSVLQGGQPIIQNAPIWLWELLAALAPKSSPFKTAFIDYKWQVNPFGLGVAPVYIYSGPSDPKSICWGTPGTSTVNGYPVLNVPLPATYDQQLNGAASFSALCRFLGEEGLNKMCPAITQPFLQRDVSSFAVTYPEIGQSYGTNGALAQTIYSEVNILSPLLSKFAEYQEPGPFYRGWHRALKGALSPTYVGCRMMEFDRIDQIRDKVSPIMLVVNFDEFFYTLSTILALAIENTAAQNGGSALLTSCPLTTQDVQILLRQAMLPIFSNHLVQDVVLGDSFFPMVPFSVGPNGAAIADSNMLLPTLLVENIRCCARRRLALGRNKNVFDIITALSRPVNQPQLSNFAVNGVPTITTVYTPPGVEVFINIVDMAYASASTSGFITPTGAEYSARLALWNTWIQTISGALSPLLVIGAEPGVSALMTGLFTRTQQDNDAFSRRKKPERSSSSKEIHLGTPSMQKNLLVGGPIVDTYINNFLEKEVFCNNKTTNSVWNFLQTFILPSALSINQTNTAGTQAWQVFQIQPYKITGPTLAGGLGGTIDTVFNTIRSRLEVLASYDVKSANQQVPNQFVADILEMAKLGRGGLFASIAGDLAGMVIPGMGGVVSGALNGIGL